MIVLVISITLDVRLLDLHAVQPLGTMVYVGTYVYLTRAASVVCVLGQVCVGERLPDGTSLE